MGWSGEWPPLIEVDRVLGVFVTELKIAGVWTPELEAQYEKASLGIQAIFNNLTRQR